MNISAEEILKVLRIYPPVIHITMPAFDPDKISDDARKVLEKFEGKWVIITNESTDLELTVKVESVLGQIAAPEELEKALKGLLEEPVQKNRPGSQAYLQS